jgi:archaellum component FlaC
MERVSEPQKRERIDEQMDRLTRAERMLNSLSEQDAPIKKSCLRDVDVLRSMARRVNTETELMKLETEVRSLLRSLTQLKGSDGSVVLSPERHIKFFEKD